MWRRLNASYLASVEIVSIRGPSCTVLLGLPLLLAVVALRRAAVGQ